MDPTGTESIADISERLSQYRARENAKRITSKTQPSEYVTQYEGAVPAELYQAKIERTTMDPTGTESIADISERLRQCRARENAKRIASTTQSSEQVTQYEGAVPAELYQRAKPSEDPIQEKIERTTMDPTGTESIADINERLRQYRARENAKRTGTESIADINERLRQYRARENAKRITSTTQPSEHVTQCEGAVPAELYQRAKLSEDPIQEKIERTMMDSTGTESIADISEHLRQYRARENAKRITSTTLPSEHVTQYEGAVPAELYQRAKPSKDPLQEKIDQYLSKQFIIPPIPDEYAIFTSITTDMRPIKYDFVDSCYDNRAGIWLERCSDEDITSLGRTSIPMLSAGFTRSGAASMFLLAYHLKIPSTIYKGYIFPDPPELAYIGDKKYHEWSEKTMVTCHPLEPLPMTTDLKKEAAVYSFIAAASLRLFTKSPANFVKAWNHILEGFVKFYGGSLDVILPTPSEAAVKSLAGFYSLDERAKVTLFRLLYMSNLDDSCLGLKRFLYDMHLSYTGLHIVNIWVQLVKILNCSPGLILTAINTNETRRQVECLVQVLKLLQSTGPAHARKMWRYGRVFDETFMADLQTRACPKLVYMLAEALRLEAPTTHKDILKIVQLNDVSEENQKKCRDAARKLLQAIKQHMAQEGESSEFQKKKDGSKKTSTRFESFK